ncbi:MAG: ribosome maturation factor RimM [Micropruina sp.]|nr:ribosome maturation factor RimM [Micropruina sp.]
MTAADVVIGTIGRAHGIRGEVSVRPRTDFVDQRFAVGQTLRAGDRLLLVLGHRLHQGSLLVTFEGIVDRSSAELLRGVDLISDLPSDDLAVSEDEFHDAQLVGLGVHLAGSGKRIGQVTAVVHNPAQDLLVVQTDAGERLVPFVSELVPVVDLALGRVEVEDLPGLLTEME